MQDVTAKRAKKTTEKPKDARQASGEGTALVRRYGQIGISAVAAAARYQGAAKNQAYAPVPVNWYAPAEEAA